MNNDQLTAIQKLVVSVKTLKDWYKIPFDKIGFAKTMTYHSRTGIQAVCRTKSTDINEIIVCLSGHEYPKEHIQVTKDAVVFDLGANIGGFGLYFDAVNKNIKYTGYAFEPFKGNLELMHQNFKLNNITKFKTYQAAISDINGTVKFNDKVSFDSMHVTKSKKGINVKSYTLSTFCKQNNIKTIDILKMDIEGGEYAILKHDMPFINKHVKTIIMEYHTSSFRSGKKQITDTMSDIFQISEIHTGATNGVLLLINNRING